jgi:tetratricopeptide (TPR) repeat protein
MKKIFIAILPVLGIFFACNSAGSKPDEEVLKAYELRMGGKVDDAKLLLENILQEDSSNAMAHFEMARLNHYMLLGGGRVKLDDVSRSIRLAVENDPDNVIYAYYSANVSFLEAYMEMQKGQGDVKEKVTEACEEFERVLFLKPDYHEAMLTLVEIYGLLPPDMGGNPEKASGYADKLASMDQYYGAKAKTILASEDFEFVKYWGDLLEKDKDNPKLLTEAGKACLYAEDPGKAESYFEQSIKLDPNNNIMILNLARYHMYMVMQDQELAAAELPLAKKYAERYLESKPEPIIPLRAYALGLLALFDRFLENPEEAEKRMEEAKSLDPYYSKATGLPSMVLFVPPGEVCYCYSSFFGPF